MFYLRHGNSRQIQILFRKSANEKISRKKNIESIDVDKVLYLTKEFVDKTPEGEVLDDLNMKKMCCRRHFLTHVDIE